VDGVGPQATGDSSKVKVKVRVNIHGLFNVSGATITEKVENAPAAATDDQEPMEVDSGEGKTTQDAAAAAEADDSKQQPAAGDGAGDSPRDSASANDVADIELANKDTADKVHHSFLLGIYFQILWPLN